ncbi:hypothetical protein [Mesorhizobium sp. 1M-11]|uniref:hypothetical protein n=1 Tax=Mesorhizobium sp. 1M-11 TaxID=1529006 RepID=UPI0006C73B44|nr:hypothetical protein [Mesorhizobium sp. 1M-11]
MTEAAKIPNDDARLEIDNAADELIAASDGDARAAVVALLIVNKLQEHELHLTRLAVSSGYSYQRHLARVAEDALQA